MSEDHRRRCHEVSHSLMYVCVCILEHSGLFVAVVVGIAICVGHLDIRTGKLHAAMYSITHNMYGITALP